MNADCFYFGHQDNGNTAYNNVFEYIYCHDTGNAVYDSMGGMQTRIVILDFKTHFGCMCHSHRCLTLRSAGYGHGVQIKTGSYNNVVRNSVFQNIAGPCVLVYDDWDLGVNVIDGTL